MGKRDRTIGSAGKIIKMGRPLKHPDLPNDWHIEPGPLRLLTPLTTQEANTLAQSMRGKSEAELKQAISVLAVAAKELRRAKGGAERADKLESYAAFMTAYLNKTHQLFIAEKRQEPVSIL